MLTWGGGLSLAGGTAVLDIPTHLAIISRDDDSSFLYSQGEDGPPGNGTEGFPGFPVSVIGLPTHLPSPPWNASGYLGG